MAQHTRNRQAASHAIQESAAVAIFRIITFLIHAIAAAIAGLAVAILTHLVPVLLVGLAGVAAVLLLCTSCGIRGLEFLRRRKENE